MVNNYKIPNVETSKETLSDIASFLRMSLESQKIITLFTNDLDPNHLSCGIVTAMSDEWLDFAKIDLHGNSDGIACLPVDIIYRVEADTPLIQRVATLWKLGAQDPFSLDVSDPDLLRAFLNQAFELQKVISLEVMDSRRYDFCGLVINVDDDFVNVEMIDGNGNPMGSSLVLIESITQGVMDAKEEHSVQRLYEYQKRIGNLT